MRDQARGLWGSIALLLLAWAVLPAIVWGQLAGPTEYEVKAAFLFNFTKFVEWPGSAFSDARAPIVVGILGEDPFGPSLSHIVAGQLTQGRGIVIRREQWGDDLRSCQVLFVGDSERAHLAQILSGLQGAGVLSVSDIDGFAEAGGVMQFVMEQSRVRFMVNLDAATRANLKINSKLLALARVINRTDP